MKSIPKNNTPQTSTDNHVQNHPTQNKKPDTGITNDGRNVEALNGIERTSTEENQHLNSATNITERTITAQEQTAPYIEGNKTKEKGELYTQETTSNCYEEKKLHEYLKKAQDFTYNYVDPNADEDNPIEFDHDINAINFHFAEDQKHFVITFYPDSGVSTGDLMANLNEATEKNMLNTNTSPINTDDPLHEPHIHKRIWPVHQHIHVKISTDGMTMDTFKDAIVEVLQMGNLRTKDGLFMHDLVRFFLENPTEPGITFDDGTYADKNSSVSTEDLDGDENLDNVFQGPFRFQKRPSYNRPKPPKKTEAEIAKQRAEIAASNALKTKELQGYLKNTVDFSFHFSDPVTKKTSKQLHDHDIETIDFHITEDRKNVVLTFHPTTEQALDNLTSNLRYGLSYNHLDKISEIEEVASKFDSDKHQDTPIHNQSVSINLKLENIDISDFKEAIGEIFTMANMAEKYSNNMDNLILHFSEKPTETNITLGDSSYASRKPE